MGASLAGGAGVEAAELALRAGLTQLGCALLEPLLAADAGYRGPRAGDIPAIRAAARAFPLTGRKAADLKTALGYFEHNAHRMHYARFKKLGMFVGSGAVEAGCKAIVGQRLKLSGMRWTEHGATGILTLRCLEASDRWVASRVSSGLWRTSRDGDDAQSISPPVCGVRSGL